MIDFAQARAKLPLEWRRIDLKKLLRQDKAHANELIRTWQDAGYIEAVPGSPSRYRFTTDDVEQSPATQPTATQPTATHEPAPAPTPTSLRERWPAFGKIAHLLPARLQDVKLPPLARREWTLLGVATLVVLVLALAGVLGRSAPTPAETPAAPVVEGPALAQSVVARYAPGHVGAVFGIVPAGTPYEPVARYGEEWVQMEFTDTGLLWVRVADVPGVTMSGLPNLLPSSSTDDAAEGSGRTEDTSITPAAVPASGQ